MATKKQIEANRRNSLKSTGLRTSEGLAKVALNRVSHGLCGAFRVFPHESQEHFEQLIARLTADQNRVGDLETELVRKMAEAMWMRKRAVDLQNASFASANNLPHLEASQVEVQVSPNLEPMVRYEAHHDRVFRRALADLLKLQKERRLREIGFVRQTSGTWAAETELPSYREALPN